MWSYHESSMEIYNISSTINLRKIYGCLARSSEEDIRILIRYIELCISSPDIPEEAKPTRWLRWIFGSNISNEHIVAPEHLLALLYLKLGDYEKSYRMMDTFFKRYNLKREDLEHLFAFRDVLFLLSKRYEVDDIEKILSNYYHKNSISMAMTMLSVPDINLIWVQAPGSSDYNYYKDRLSIFEKIRKKVEASSIDQYKLRECFY